MSNLENIIAQIWLGCILAFGVYAVTGANLLAVIIVGGITVIFTYVTGFIFPSDGTEMNANKINSLSMENAFLKKQLDNFQQMCKEYEDSVLTVCGPEAKSQVDAYWTSRMMTNSPDEIKNLIKTGIKQKHSTDEKK